MAKLLEIQPLGKRVLVKPRKVKEEVRGGLIVPIDSIKQKTIGTVMAVGGEVTLVKVGDEIYFSPLHYEEVDEDNFTIDERDIWAKIVP